MQIVNRDLSIAVVRAFLSKREEEPTSGRNKKNSSTQSRSQPEDKQDAEPPKDGAPPNSIDSKMEDIKSRVQNSGVTIQAEAVHFASSKDKNPITASMNYFGVIEDIWEIDYVTFRVPVFKCKWVDGNTGVRIDHLGFTLVDLNKTSYTKKPFIMACQARQIFYVNDPCNEKWSVVLEGRSMQLVHEDDSLDVHETPSFSSATIGVGVDIEVDDMDAILPDHDEGIWENIPT